MKILPRYSDKKVFIYILIASILIQISFTQETTSTLTVQGIEYSGILGLGWGVISIILTIIIGILCCVLGSGTVYPGLFVFLGFLLPLIMFIFMISVPLDQPGNINLKDNPAVNSFIIVKWFFLSFIILGLVILAIPFCNLWNNMLIPQRVDSRAQREYYEKYEKLLKQERLKIDRENEIRKKAAESNDLNKNEAEILLPVNHSPVEGNNMQQNIQILQNIQQNNQAENFNSNEGNFNNQFNNLNPVPTQERKKKFLSGLRRRKENNEEISDN
jgi:hypothetical protein